MWFIFANIDEAGRTGHNYNNFFDSKGNLHWKGKTNSKYEDPSIQKLVNLTTKTYIFTRESNKDDWTFKGLEKAISVNEKSIPVEVEWELFDNQYINISVNYDDFNNISEYDKNLHITGKEGEERYFLGKRYERNPKLRTKAIEIHGTTCLACGFNFERFYGDHGAGFIEIHHIKPLHIEKKEVVVNIKEDLMPLCANCHRMIHRSKNICIEKLCEIINNK